MRRTIVALACALGALAVTPALAPAAVQVGSSGWQWGNPLPQGNAIRALSFAGTQGYAGGDFGTLLHTTDAGATWTGLPSGTFRRAHRGAGPRRRLGVRRRRLRRPAL
jgi:hypothetical protein